MVLTVRTVLIMLTLVVVDAYIVFVKTKTPPQLKEVQRRYGVLRGHIETNGPPKFQKLTTQVPLTCFRRGGDDDSSSADEDDYRRMEEPHLRNDWFDHYAYERELNAPILSKIRAPTIFSYDKKKTIAGTGPDGANGDGQGPDSDLITKRFIHDTYRKMEVSDLNQYSK